MATEYIAFARRLNRDSSIDSICVKCYQTIATGHSDDELIACEQSHVCDPNSEFARAHVDFRESTSNNTWHRATRHRSH